MSGWTLAFIMGALAFLGLVMASQAVDGIFYGTGLLLFVLGTLFVFFIIGRNMGR